MSIVLYPGSFDPITNGHLDVIARASQVFDRMIVTVAINSRKQTLFSDDERIDLIRRAVEESLPSVKNVEVERISGLLADFARERGATSVVRGLRTLGDFEYEMQMALMNRRLNGDLSTYFLAADEKYVHVNSTIVREIARFGAPLGDLVPRCVEEALRDKFKIQNSQGKKR